MNNRKSLSAAGQPEVRLRRLVPHTSAYIIPPLRFEIIPSECNAKTSDICNTVSYNVFKMTLII
jgi:hypothetical protein